MILATFISSGSALTASAVPRSARIAADRGLVSPDSRDKVRRESREVNVKRAASVAFIGCLILGCTFVPPKPGPVPAAVTIPANFDRTWTALIEALAEMQLTVTSMEKASGLVAADWIRFLPTEHFGDCGSVQGYPPILANQVRFNVFVKADGSAESRMTVNAAFRSMSSPDTPHEFPCESTGVFEERLRQKILSKLGQL